MWNQRRPFLAYWGTQGATKYLQVRFLHDDYDFSSASFFSQQKENCVLACINFVTGGGDKHISIDRITDGMFRAKDLRLRFEFGNVKESAKMILPDEANSQFTIKTDDLSFTIQMFAATFSEYQGYWEKGGDNRSSWVDLVLYSGIEKEFNLKLIEKAIIGFTFILLPQNEEPGIEKPSITEKAGNLTAIWKNMSVSIPVKPLPLPKNL
jgi:hypothetical protein